MMGQKQNYYVHATTLLSHMVVVTSVLGTSRPALVLLPELLSNGMSVQNGRFKLRV